MKKTVAWRVEDSGSDINSQLKVQANFKYFPWTLDTRLDVTELFVQGDSAVFKSLNHLHRRNYF